MRAAPHQRVTLDDLNTLGRSAGMTRRLYFDADSWNALIDHINRQRPADTEPLSRHRRGAILTSAAWNRVVEAIGR